VLELSVDVLITLINEVAEQAGATELGGTVPFVVAERLRITRAAEASRRIRKARDLDLRWTMTGYLEVIRDFWHRLPAPQNTRQFHWHPLASISPKLRLLSGAI
jgi:hypothetical protein